jgi:uncharacterized sulfatase
VVFMEYGRYEAIHDSEGGFQPIRAVFDGRWKLVINLLSMNEYADELYDLHNDPDENVNLILSPQCAATRDALHDRILTWMNETVDPFRGYCWERRPWRKDARPMTWDYTKAIRPVRHEPTDPQPLGYDTARPEAE